MPKLFSVYTKEALLEHLAKAIPDGTVIVTTNVMKAAEALPKFGIINVTQSHAAEFFKNGEGNVSFLMDGTTIPFSMMICKKEVITKEWLDKLKKDKGMSGFKYD